SPAKLIEDILHAGAGLSNEEAVRFLAVEGPRVVRELLVEGVQVPFSTTEEGELDLTQEGAHSLPRIIHAGDATGRAIETSPPHRAGGQEGQSLPDLRGAARRGSAPEEPEGAILHGEVLARAARPRAARRRGAGHRGGDDLEQGRLRLPRPGQSLQRASADQG